MSDPFVNLNDFLKNLKTKEVKPLGLQEIFNKVVRQIVRQGLPCVRIDDTTGEVSLVNFNSSGFLSPWMMFFSREDIRVLQKTLGYEFLQRETDLMEHVDVFTNYRDSSEEAIIEDEAVPFRLIGPVRKLDEFLQMRGIGLGEDQDSTNLLARLTRNHEAWYNGLLSREFVSQTKYVDNLHDSCLAYLHPRLMSTADRFRLSTEVLNWDRP